MQDILYLTTVKRSLELKEVVPHRLRTIVLESIGILINPFCVYFSFHTMELKSWVYDFNMMLLNSHLSSNTLCSGPEPGTLDKVISLNLSVLKLIV